MRRREFIAALGGATMSWPRHAAGQQTDPARRIAVLQELDSTDPEADRRVAAFERALESLGWINGHNIRIDYRWDAGDPQRSRSSALEVISLAPELILTAASSVLKAVASETKSIPIVFVLVADPVGLGFVASLAHPGRNVTGFAGFEPAMGGKWLSLLKEAAPNVSHVRFLFNPVTAPFGESLLGALAAAAPTLALKVIAATVHDEAEIERAVIAAATESGGGMIVAPDAFTYVRRQEVVALAAQHRLPTIYPFRGFVESGGLISYGIDLLAPFEQAAVYVDRILKGVKPAYLPVQGPIKFDLVVNLKTAKALGLDIPATLLARADEVID
jgi:putative ABC transport system substrate-binding protein